MTENNEKNTTIKNKYEINKSDDWYRIAFDLDCLVTEAAISHDKAKTITHSLCEGYFGEENIKNNTWKLVYEYKRNKTYSEIVYDYLAELEKNLEKIKNQVNKLHQLTKEK